MPDTERLRKMITPEPTYYYPTPWRGAETRNGKRIVTCADGSYTAECPTNEAADIIVAAVNAYATGLTREIVRADAEQSIALRGASPGRPQDGPYPATVDEVDDELAAFITELDTRSAPGVTQRIVDRLTAPRAPDLPY